VQIRTEEAAFNPTSANISPDHEPGGPLALATPFQIFFGGLLAISPKSA
jgi:hypothetical protein